MTPSELAAALLRNESPVYGGARWHLHRGTVHLHSDGDATEAYAMRDAVQQKVDDLGHSDAKRGAA